VPHPSTARAIAQPSDSTDSRGWPGAGHAMASAATLEHRLGTQLKPLLQQLICVQIEAVVCGSAAGNAGWNPVCLHRGRTRPASPPQQLLLLWPLKPLLSLSIGEIVSSKGPVPLEGPLHVNASCTEVRPTFHTLTQPVSPSKATPLLRNRPV
jgi:hypothetical protein